MKSYAFTFNFYLTKECKLSLLTPPALAVWSLNFYLTRELDSSLSDTTGFSRVESQFLPNFAHPQRLKLNLHTTEVGGIFERVGDFAGR